MSITAIQRNSYQAMPQAVIPQVRWLQGDLLPREAAKVHSLMLRRDLLVFSCLALGSLSLFLAYVITPLFGVTLVASVVFLVLGIKKTNELVEKIQVPPQEFIANQPLGLRNEAVDCAFNALSQMLFNIPVFKPYILKLGEKQAFKPFCNQAKIYWDEQEKNQKATRPQFVSKANTLKIRECVFDVAPKGRIFSRMSRMQEDAADCLDTILEGADYKTPIKQVTNEGEPIDISEPLIRLSLTDPKNPTKTPSFEQMVHDYFISEDPVAKNKIRKYYERAPLDIMFAFRRTENAKKDPKKISDKEWENTVMDEKGNIVQRKNDAPVDAPLIWQMPKEFCKEEKANYACDAIVIHLGSKPPADHSKGGGADSGHYIACVKQEKQWWLLNDSQYPETLTEKEVQEKYLPNAYIVHYSLLQNQIANGVTR